MARTVDEAAHDLRREAFVDAMRELLLTKGFQAATIADVLAITGASKGAFYHYFESKDALLEGLTQRMLTEMAAAVEPVVEAEASATVKLDRFSGTLAQWKSSNRAIVLAASRAWRADGNSLPREKLRQRGRRMMAGHLAAIIRQGNAEGAFHTPDPELTARLALVLLHDLQDTLVDWVLGRPPDADELAEIDRNVAGYHRALERLLGAAADSIHIVTPAVLTEWFES